MKKNLTLLFLALATGSLPAATDIVPKPADPGNLGASDNRFPTTWGEDANFSGTVTGLFAGPLTGIATQLGTAGAAMRKRGTNLTYYATLTNALANSLPADEIIVSGPHSLYVPVVLTNITLTGDRTAILYNYVSNAAMIVPDRSTVQSLTLSNAANTRFANQVLLGSFGPGGQVGYTNGIVRDCTFYSVGGYGIYSRETSSAKLNNLDIYDSQFIADYAGAASDGYDRVRAYNCTFYTYGGTNTYALEGFGISVAYGWTSEGFSTNELHDCSFYSYGATNGGVCFGIYIIETTQTIIDGCNFYTWTTPGAIQCDSLNISGDGFTKITGGNITQAGGTEGSGIYLQGGTPTVSVIGVSFQTTNTYIRNEVGTVQVSGGNIATANISAPGTATFFSTAPLVVDARSRGGGLGGVGLNIYASSTPADAIQVHDSSSNLTAYVTAAGAGTFYGGVNVGSGGQVALTSAGAGTFSGTLTANLFSGSGASLTTLNASSLSSGTVPSARGGAGTVNGILKANGSGTVSAATAGTDYLTTANLITNWAAGVNMDVGLVNFRSRLNTAQTSRLHIFCYGDSITAGLATTPDSGYGRSTNSWVGRLRTRLQAEFGGSGIGFIPAYAQAASYSPYNFTLTGTWGNGSAGAPPTGYTGGPQNGGVFATGAANTAELTNVTCTAFEIHWTENGFTGGEWVVDINGTPRFTNAQSSTVVSKSIVLSSNLTAATITIHAPGGGSYMMLNGVSLYSSATGVFVDNIGLSGALAVGVAGGLEWSSNINVGLYIATVDSNDAFNQTSLATYGTYITNLVSTAKGFGAGVLLIHGPFRANCTPLTQPSYFNVERAAALGLGAGVLSIYDRWNEPTSTALWSTDSIHPDVQGHADWARYLTPWLVY